MGVERRLILMRHATAVSGASCASDHERPLAEQGVAEAEATAREILAAGWRPQRVFVSDAARTSETWWSMASVLGEPESSLLPRFYGAGIEEIVAVVSRVPSGVEVVLAIGHNPGWSDAVDWLSGEGIGLAPAQAALLHGRGDRWVDVLGHRSLDLVQWVGPGSSILR